MRKNSVGIIQMALRHLHFHGYAGKRLVLNLPYWRFAVFGNHYIPGDKLRNSFQSFWSVDAMRRSSGKQERLFASCRINGNPFIAFMFLDAIRNSTKRQDAAAFERAIRASAGVSTTARRWRLRRYRWSWIRRFRAAR